MAKETGISWTSSTINLVWGCTRISDECKHCYLYRLSKIYGRDPYKVNITKGSDSAEGISKKIQPLGSKIFVNSMSDTFHRDIPDSLLDLWFETFAAHKEKTFQILTKRPERARAYFAGAHVPDNIWLGVSVGVKASMHRIDTLREIDARIRFISIEPLLEDLGELNLEGISWLILGGESDNKNPRPMAPEWAENIIEQAKREHVAVWFKQLGGKDRHHGGDLLNGRRIQEFPSAFHYNYMGSRD